MSFFEAGMLISFGLAWPLNIYKSIKTRSTKGKSLMFLMVIWCGYISGIIHKLLYSNDVVMYLYLLNLVMVSIDIGLYFYNRMGEKRQEALSC